METMDYWPDVLQVLPTVDYKVYIYFDDGTIRLYDATEQLKVGRFKQLLVDDMFMTACTVINNTLAWTLDFSYTDKGDNVLDLDPIQLYNTCPIVDEPLHLFNLNEDESDRA